MSDTPKKVAAYIRVGVSDAFKPALEAEKVKFEKSIRNHGTWEFAGCYADTGPASLESPELQHLMEDCRAGKIDIIITKGTSRMSKNLADIIKISMELMLLEPPVGIVFMEENCFTLQSNEIFCLGGFAAIEAEQIERRRGLRKPDGGDGDE